MRNFSAELSALKDILGFDPNMVEQGTDQWQRMRSGVITASKADCLLSNSKLAPMPDGVEIVKEGKINKAFYNGREFEGTKADVTRLIRESMPPVHPESRQGYMSELVAQVCTGLLPDEISAKALRWGKDHEEDARDAYSAATFEIVGELPFIYKDSSMRVGLSPDGVCSTYGLELKCPWASRTFIEFAAAEKVRPEYWKQCQFSMWGTDLDRWDFANYDPRMHNCKKLHFITIDRDEKTMVEFDEKGAAFIEDMDKMLAKMGVRFGQQWEISE